MLQRFTHSPPQAVGLFPLDALWVLFVVVVSFLIQLFFVSIVEIHYMTKRENLYTPVEVFKIEMIVFMKGVIVKLFT